MKWTIVTLLFVARLAQAEPMGSGVELARPTVDLPMRGEFNLPDNQVKTVVVRGYGETPTLARYDGFRTAIEHVAGVAIVSETQINNQRIQRDQTATYSQARISSFHVLSLESTARGWSTQMWVTVRNICERGSHNCLN